MKKLTSWVYNEYKKHCIKTGQPRNHFIQTQQILNLTRQNMKTGAASEPTDHKITQIARHKSKFKKTHQQLNNPAQHRQLSRDLNPSSLRDFRIQTHFQALNRGINFARKRTKPSFRRNRFINSRRYHQRTQRKSSDWNVFACSS